MDAGHIDMIVNTTSLGMHPHADLIPSLPNDGLLPGQFIYDLIYAPPETRLLAEARRAGCQAANGLRMLIYQGALSLSYWTGIPVEDIPVEIMEKAVAAR